MFQLCFICFFPIIRAFVCRCQTLNGKEPQHKMFRLTEYISRNVWQNDFPTRTGSFALQLWLSGYWHTNYQGKGTGISCTKSMISSSIFTKYICNSFTFNKDMFPFTIFLLQQIYNRYLDTWVTLSCIKCGPQRSYF